MVSVPGESKRVCYDEQRKDGTLGGGNTKQRETVKKGRVDKEKGSEFLLCTMGDNLSVP